MDIPDMRSDMVRRGVVTMAAILLLSVILTVGPAGWIFAEENMPVTCYKDGSRIGTVTVFDWRTAAATCNTTLYDCKGACIGCFHDFDYVDNVCIDMNGREFLR